MTVIQIIQPKKFYHYLFDNVSFLCNLTQQINLSLIYLFRIFQRSSETSQSQLEVKISLFRIWKCVKNIKRFQNTWPNRIIGYCEIILNIQPKLQLKILNTEACNRFLFPGASVVNNLPAKKETQVQSQGWEDPLEKEMAAHSSMGNPMDRGAWQTTVHGV